MIDMPPPTPWTRIAGGEHAVRAAYTKYALLTRVSANRLYNLPERPGSVVACDPDAATLEFRGRVFRAELLGSFDGRSWLWSWANPFLKLPPERTRIASRLREASDALGIGALAVPHIKTENEALPRWLGSLAVGLGLGDGYCLAGPQVYVLAPGELDALDAGEPLDELGHALRALAGELPDMEPALRVAADALGLVVETSGDLLSVHDGAGAKIELFRDGMIVEEVLLARCFLSRTYQMAYLVERLTGDPRLAHLEVRRVSEHEAELVQPGLSIRLTRSERLREIMAEAAAIPGEEDKARARRHTAFVRVQVTRRPEYQGVPYGVFSPMVQAVYAAKYYPLGSQPAGLKRIEDMPVVPREALDVCELLASLENTSGYDEILLRWLGS